MLTAAAMSEAFPTIILPMAKLDPTAETPELSVVCIVEILEFSRLVNSTIAVESLVISAFLVFVSNVIAVAFAVMEV